MKDIFEQILKNIYGNTFLLIIIYVLIIIIFIVLVLKIRKILKGNFGEANIFRRLKRIYNQYDYPYINQIILPINKESFAYYDSIVFGNKFIYILEIKNHSGNIKVDAIDDWIYLDKNKEKYTIVNPFYELELKKHILNRFLEIDRSRIIEVVVYNNNTKCIGNKKNHHLIAVNQIAALIKHYEKKDVSRFTPDLIEKKGNYILDINIKNKKIRKKVINDLENQRTKR